MLTEEENFAGLARINRELIGRVEAVDSPQRVVLDMDSTEIPVYGQQEQSACNGHFESACYHPLLLFNRDGDCLAEKLRSGNVHSADDWPVVRYEGFLYQAESWKKARRVVAKVEFHAGELFPRVGFIVTNLETDSRAVVRFYNQRATAEQWIREGKQAVTITRLSCHRFRSNEVRLWLSVMAYTLENLWRRLVLAHRIGKLVANESAAAVSEYGRAPNQTCPLLLAPAGGEPSDAAAVRGHAAADLGAAGAGRIGDGC